VGVHFLRRQVSGITFFMTVPDIFVSSVRNLFPVIFLKPKIFRYLIIFYRKITEPWIKEHRTKISVKIVLI
jgi:hypothetical protein